MLTLASKQWATPKGGQGDLFAHQRDGVLKVAITPTETNGPDAHG